MDGRIAAAGFDARALDFIGYGEADRWPATSESAPLGRATDAATQIAQAVDCIRRRHDGVRIAIVAHSWGTVPAGALRTVTREQQWQSFLHGVPDDCEPPFERSLFDAWITSYVEGTHRYHLERNRRQLYRAVQTFLEEID